LLAPDELLCCFYSMQFWLDKAVAWGQADSPDTQKDTCLHLNRLRDFLQQLLAHINNMVTETMKKLPLLGQFLGRLCWNPYVTAGDTFRRPLLQCLWGLYSEHPSNAVERKANQWIRKVLCQLATEEDDGVAQALMKHMGVPAKEYHVNVLKKVLSKYSYWCSCDSILATSDACVPLITCPEASPLIGALLQQPVTCVKEALSEHFLDALSSAYSSWNLSLEEQAVVSLWYHSLPSLEEAVLSLLESVTNTVSTPQMLHQQVAQSLLVGILFFFMRNLSIRIKSVCCVVLSFCPLGGTTKCFETWFLLVQCAHWVQAAVQLLVTSEPEDCGPLLWLLTFYHHPTTGGTTECFGVQVRAREAWEHLRSVFLVSARPPIDRLQSLVTPLSSQPQQPSPAPLLTLSLLVNLLFSASGR
uniref:FA complementation group C n=1 Tax=Amphiprion percula TaxID=161767 RepID=A0A3P8S5Q0_AMPPE